MILQTVDKGGAPQLARVLFCPLPCSQMLHVLEVALYLWGGTVWATCDRGGMVLRACDCFVNCSRLEGGVLEGGEGWGI